MLGKRENTIAEEISWFEVRERIISACFGFVLLPFDKEGIFKYLSIPFHSVIKLLNQNGKKNAFVAEAEYRNISACHVSLSKKYCS